MSLNNNLDGFRVQWKSTIDDCNKMYKGIYGLDGRKAKNAPANGYCIIISLVFDNNLNFCCQFGFVLNVHAFYFRQSNNGVFDKWETISPSN